MSINTVQYSTEDDNHSAYLHSTAYFYYSSIISNSDFSWETQMHYSTKNFIY